MSGEMPTEGAEEGEEARGDVLWRREVRGEGEVGVERTECLGELEETRDRWGVVQVASEGEEVADQRVCHLRVVCAEVPSLVNGDDALVRLQCSKVVSNQVVREIVLEV